MKIVIYNMNKESIKKARKKYDQKNTVGIYLKLNLKTDKDILKKLESVNHKQTYIKKLIRLDIREFKY